MFEFFHSDQFIALIVSLFIFLVTVVLVVKRWIGFPMALLLLLFSLAAGLIINHQDSLRHYFEGSPSSAEVKESQDSFQKQITQAIQDLKIEVRIEKEKLSRVMLQVQEVVDSIDMQKQKLQHFIEETRERFKAEYGPKNSSTDS